MAWTAPITAVYNAALTVAQWNATVRDNSLETMTGKATAAQGRWFVSTGANAIAERVITNAAVVTQETTTSNTYVDLLTVGPTATVTTGTKALVFFGCLINNNVAGTTQSFMSVGVSSASTVAASDDWSMTSGGINASNSAAWATMHLFTGLTAGSNIFTCKYRVTGASTGTFEFREMTVVPL